MCSSDAVRVPNSGIRDETSWPDFGTWDIGENRGLSSLHVGGVQILLADGSVRFVSNNIDLVTWRGVASMNGSERLGDW